jgi:hypothetical protein
LSAAVLGILYGGIGFYGVPSLLRQRVETYAQSHGHQARLSGVSFNPFTLTLRAKDIQFTADDGKPDLSIRSVSAQFNVRSLFEGTAALDDLAIDVDAIHVTRRADGRWNLAPLLPAPDPKAPWPAMRLHSGALLVETLTIGDVSGEPRLQWALQQLQLSVRDFDTRQPVSEWRLRALSDREEEITADAQLALTPLSLTADLSLKNVDFTRVAELSQGVIAHTDGRAQGQGRLSWSQQEADRVVLSHIQLSGQRLTLAQPGTDSLQVSLAGIDVADGHYDSHGPQLGFSSLNLRAPNLTLPTNMRALLQASSDQSTAATVQWQIGRIQVNEGRVNWVDEGHQTPATWKAEDIALTLSPSADARRQLTMTAGVGGSGHLTLEGVVADDLSAADLKIQTDQMPVLELAPYIESLVALRVGSGLWSARGQLTRHADTWTYHGALALDQIRTSERGQHQDLLGVDHLDAEGVEARWPDPSLRIGTLSAQTPYADVRIGSNGRSNLSDLLSKHDPADRSLVPPVTIDHITVHDGRLHFADESQSPTFEAGIADLAGQIQGLSSDPATRAHLAFSGHVDRYAPVSIEGDANLIAEPIAADVRLHFDNLELTGLSPYSGRFAGYQIHKGKATADLVYHVAEHRVEATHHVRLNQFELGSRVEGGSGFGVPLGLVVALLKDRNGNIDLDVPLSGSLDDPNFSLAALTKKVVGNLFRKIVTSPFSLLGGLFGSREDISKISFDAGAVEPTAASRLHLQTLSRALLERPGLSIDIPIAVAPLDADALAAAKLQASMLNRARTLLGDAPDDVLRTRMETSPTERRAVLVSLSGQQDSGADAKALEAALLHSLQPSKDDLEQLATSRAQAAQRVLIESTQIDPARVFLIRGATATPVEGRVELSIAVHGS